MNGETEAVFNADGSIKFFNINAGNETMGRYAPTPVDLYLSNTTLTGTYEATNSITVEDNVTVGGPTLLKAGNIINLKPGFTASYGSDFTAKIGTVTNTPKRFYYLKDHLGSIRVVVDEAGEIASSDDYDPWGMTLEGRSYDIGYFNAKYKFTSKERDIETGYDYFGARYYDSRLGRWMQVDPLAEKYFGWSPYNYTLNNPLRFIDPDGKQSTDWLKVFFKAIVRVVTEPIKNEAIDEILNRTENKDMLGERPIGSSGDIDKDGIDDSKDGIDNRFFFKEMVELKKNEDRMNESFRKTVEEGIKKEKQKQWNDLMEQSQTNQLDETKDEYELDYIAPNEALEPIKLNEDDLEDINR